VTQHTHARLGRATESGRACAVHRWPPGLTTRISGKEVGKGGVGFGRGAPRARARTHGVRGKMVALET